MPKGVRGFQKGHKNFRKVECEVITPVVESEPIREVVLLNNIQINDKSYGPGKVTVLDGLAKTLRYIDGCVETEKIRERMSFDHPDENLGTVSFR